MRVYMTVCCHPYLGRTLGYPLSLMSPTTTGSLGLVSLCLSSHDDTYPMAVARFRSRLTGSALLTIQCSTGNACGQLGYQSLAWAKDWASRVS